MRLEFSARVKHADILIRYAKKENLTFRVGISTRDSASLVPGRNSDPSGEISLPYVDTHDGLL